MSLANRLTVARAGPRRTLRLRLTALYSLLFLAAGAGLLAITYLLVRSAPNGKLDPGKPLIPAIGSKFGVKQPATTVGALKAAQLRAQALTTHAIDIHELLTRSVIALAIMAVLAVALGWLVAGRMLRPLRTMTAATRQITENNLHERLALPGPSDEIKELADTIDGLLQRLEAAFDAQRHFVANASHELLTPLTLNRALLDVTLTNPHATVEDLRTMGQELIASGEQQEQLVEALLTLATSARGLERHESFDLSEITRDVLLDPHPQIDRLGLEVQTDIAPAPATGDPRLAERLIANLVDNAIRHNIPGGHLTIATRTESGHAVLTIANSGVTIPQAEIDRLLQPFQRLHSGRANHPDGHGLGLSIVQSIAAAHRATLDARPRRGGGLEIEVRFPPAAAGGGNGGLLAQRADPSASAR